jgi:hypothetical protein
MKSESISHFCNRCGADNEISKNSPGYGEHAICARCHKPLDERGDLESSPTLRPSLVTDIFGWDGVAFEDIRCPHCNRMNHAVVFPEQGSRLAWYVNAKPARPEAFVIDVSCVYCKKAFVIEWDLFPIGNPNCNYCGSSTQNRQCFILADDRRENFERHYGGGPRSPSLCKNGQNQSLWIACTRCMAYATTAL